MAWNCILYNDIKNSVKVMAFFPVRGIKINSRYKKEAERGRERAQRDRGQMNRCYLTGAVGPAWCVGSRYDRDFAYTV